MNRSIALVTATLTLVCAHSMVLAADGDRKSGKPTARSGAESIKAQRAARSESAATERTARRAVKAAPAKKAAARPLPVATVRKAEALLAAAAVLSDDLPISATQLEIASRVLIGTADCEMNQSVRVEPQPDRPGYFRVAFRNTAYSMVPEETSTGAVRLHDPRAGVVWLQIPTKSMLMNAKVGQRVVDACMQPEQRLAAATPPAQASSLGWSTPAPAAPAAPALASSLALPVAQADASMPSVSALAAGVPLPAGTSATLAAAPDAGSATAATGAAASGVDATSSATPAAAPATSAPAIAPR